MKTKTFVSGTAFFYQNIAKKIFFMMDPEIVHEMMTNAGEVSGQIAFLKKFLASQYSVSSPVLSQEIDGIRFENPLGLAAGFDYDAKLTQFLYCLGFGFQTIGTITNSSYGGNTRPMLGRLPKSQSLLVNKGFKNRGAYYIADKLQHKNFQIPLGISVGRTNTEALKTQKESIEDILQAFQIFEKNKTKNSYYELNISCPNLKGDITFYPPENLNELLLEVENLHLKKPVYIKMPIEKTDKEILEMFNVITKYKTIKGVIFGNLQENKQDPALVQSEVAKFKMGYYSGKPTQKRSDELIALAYKHIPHLTIIGCGGVFCVDDAYKKIRLGANLVQLITGLIYKGPQLVSQINTELIALLKKDGFRTISEARGVDNK
jgi:dihydroorotate dehydrogenase subfamily 2